MIKSGKVLMLAATLLVASCDLDLDLDLDFDIVPDITKTVSEVYDISIEADIPSGYTHGDMLDISEFKQYVDSAVLVAGYEIEQVTCEILEYNAPADLHFSGFVNAYDADSTVMYTLANISHASLQEFADLGQEQEMQIDTTALDHVLEWLDSEGIFQYNMMFAFENADSSTYVFQEEDFGSSFKLKVNFHILIKTE